MPHRLHPRNLPTSPIFPASLEARADHSLRRGTACCARCNVSNQRQSFADFMSAHSHPLIVFPDLARRNHISTRHTPKSRSRRKQTIKPSLPGARNGHCDARNSIAEVFSNRERELLESSLTHRKQRTASRSNRELSTNPRCGNSHVVDAFLPFLTGTASHTEFAVNRSKQTIARFLTGARIAQHNLNVPRSFLPVPYLQHSRRVYLGVQPLPHSTHPTPSGIMQRTCH